MISIEQLKKMEKCSYLLPDPGGEVVRELIIELLRIKVNIKEAAEAKRE